MMPGPIWKEIRPADVATLVNAFMGLAAIMAAFDGHTALAWHILFAAILVDGLDGAIARMGGGGGSLGQIIDTLADVVTFVVAPTILLMLALEPMWWAPALLFAAYGLLRLARFQTLEASHFYGLSTPGGTILVGTAALLAPEAWMIGASILVAAVLMLVRIPVPKLRGLIGIVGVLIILTNLVAYATSHPEVVPATLIAQVGFMLIYLIAGPSYVRRRIATEAA